MDARASDPIEAPALGASATVKQPHVTAELIPEVTTVEPGKTFEVALHLHADAGWHTYWINPGDAGLATSITWTLPPGFTAGPIQWPTPEKHAMGPLITYGYGGDVYLLTTITPPPTDLPQHFELKAKASWLVCEEECVPGQAELTLPLDSGLLNLRPPEENKDLFDEARARLPAVNVWWDVTATYQVKGGVSGTSPPEEIYMLFDRKGHEAIGFPISVEGVQFFPEQTNVLSTAGISSFVESMSQLQITVDLAQNGDKPDHLSGVLVFDQPKVGTAKSTYIADFSGGVCGCAFARDRSGYKCDRNGAASCCLRQPGQQVVRATGGEPVARRSTATR